MVSPCAEGAGASTQWHVDSRTGRETVSVLVASGLRSLGDTLPVYRFPVPTHTPSALASSSTRSAGGSFPSPTILSPGNTTLAASRTQCGSSANGRLSTTPRIDPVLRGRRLL